MLSQSQLDEQAAVEIVTWRRILLEVMKKGDQTRIAYARQMISKLSKEVEVDEGNDDF